MFDSEMKSNVEKIFEEVRRQKYSTYPSRLDALFVLPEIEMVYDYLSGMTTEHKIFTLKIDAPIYWFDMDIFNITGPMCDNTIYKEAEDYWSKGKTKYKDVETMHDSPIIEGLTYGDARIIFIDGADD